MKLVTNKFKSGGLDEKYVVATWNLGNHLSISLKTQGIIIIIIIIIIINCNWVVARWQWLFYTHTKYEIGYYYT